jgi:ABC-type branched-subunit amino acid transport system ATPase component/ABC-type branched-subunit amino acid transport system permease subunit
VEIVRFGLLGLGVGSVYAIVGLSIILVYRSSGVLNFSAGSVSAVAAYLYYDLTAVHSWPKVPALVVTLLAGALLGAATHQFVMSRLRTASTLAKLIASLGILTVIQALIELRWGANPLFAESLLPEGTVEFTPALNIAADRIWLIGICAVLTVGLAALYSKTSFGRATSAVAQNRRAAASLGWSTNVIELANWTISGALSALAGVLLAPIVGLQVATLTLLVVPALASALIGGFSSFGLTAAGALLIGVLEAETAKYVAPHVTGAASSVPFLVIILVVVAGGRARPARGDLPTRLPGLGTGRVPPVLTTIGILVGVAIIVFGPGGASVAMGTSATAALMVLSVIVVTGYAGQLSLGQWAIAGMGAWAAARLVDASLPFWLAAPLGVLAAVPVGLLVALPALRTRGVNLAVTTLGLALVVQAMVLQNSDLTGGADGLRVGSPSLFGISLDPIEHRERFALLCLVSFVLVALVVANVRRGQVGRRLVAVRSNEAAAASLGIGVYGAKLYAFALASAIAAVAGILTAFRTPIVVFTQFGIFGSINAVLWSVIGGIGWVSGAIAGAQFAPGSLFGWIMTSILDEGFTTWLVVISGVGVITTLIFAPEGIGAHYHQMAERVRARLGRVVASSSDRPGRLLPPKVRPAFNLLEVSDLAVRYGAVLAVSDVSFQLRPGEVLGLIGPNGAGKTTLLDAVTGFTAPSQGTVTLDGTDITTWSPVRRARAGVSRSFQGVQLFDELTVRDNLLVAADPPGAWCYFRDLVWPGRRPTSAVLEALVDEFDLRAHLDARPGDLSQGVRRLVGIGRAVATEPNVLFLDEPAAGLDQAESAELGRLIRQLASDRNVAVVLVEHDVEMVMSTCDRVLVLDFGQVIAFSDPATVRNDPRVVEAYLGVVDELEAEVAAGPEAMVHE